MDMKKAPSPEETTFEQAMERLEEIVAELDRGDLALEEALKLFQEGTALRETCERKLAEAEAMVEELLQPAEGEAEAAPPAANDNLFGDDDE
jgi:exodeoxyribonuclease VII small subunit